MGSLWGFGFGGFRVRGLRFYGSGVLGVMVLGFGVLGFGVWGLGSWVLWLCGLHDLVVRVFIGSLSRRGNLIQEYRC